MVECGLVLRWGFPAFYACEFIAMIFVFAFIDSDTFHTETAIDWENDKSSALNHLRHVEGLQWWILAPLFLQAATHVAASRYKTEDNKGSGDELGNYGPTADAIVNTIGDWDVALFQVGRFLQMWFTAALCFNFLGYADFWGILLGASLFASTSVMHASIERTSNTGAKAGFTVSSLLIVSTFIAFVIVRWVQSTDPEVCYFSSGWTPVMAIGWMLHALLFIFKTLLAACGHKMPDQIDLWTDFAGYHMMVLGWLMIMHYADQSCGVPP